MHASSSIHILDHPVQKQGRPVPNQRSAQAERLRNTDSCREVNRLLTGRPGRFTRRGGLQSGKNVAGSVRMVRTLL
jgi:hypothetical protein